MKPKVLNYTMFLGMGMNQEKNLSCPRYLRLGHIPNNFYFILVLGLILMIVDRSRYNTPK